MRQRGSAQVPTGDDSLFVILFETATEWLTNKIDI